MPLDKHTEDSLAGSAGPATRHHDDLPGEFADACRDPGNRVRELHGVIVYAAGAIVFEEDRNAP